MGKEVRARELVAGALMPGVPGPGGSFLEQPAKRTAHAAKMDTRAARAPDDLNFDGSDIEKDRK
jgi:hypothetical protein